MTMLFTGGRVFDGLGRTLDGHAVLIQGGEIARVAPAGEFDGYAGRKIDTTGMTLMPGLGDCHVHLVYTGGADPNGILGKQSPGEITLTALANAQAELQGGVTAVRDCGGKDYLELTVRNAIARGVFVGPTIRAAGRMICMTGGHGNRLARVADGVDDVIRAVREQVHAGCDLVKMMATGGVVTPGVNPMDAHYTAEEMRAGLHEAKRFHKSTASHAQGTEGILNAVRGGVDSIEHGIFMDDECLREMLERQTYLVPTIAALRNILDNADKGIPDYMVEKTRGVAERHRESFRMYYRAGGRIAMGTDAGTPYNLHGENAMELAYMVDFGMAPVDALIAGTSRAHDLMGLVNAGRILKGALADLLLVKGDPTRDIDCVAKRVNHVAVFKGGVPVMVETGRYGSKSEVLREGVRLIQDRETRLAALDAVIERGIADSDAGRGKSAEEVFDRLEAKYQALAKGQT
ncbi:MAG: type II toxin-antitoxin system ParD family antitoxin [Zoogloeaceae bacterium]|jgi:putative addiction module CopG family antidote|nr:type II toxin-antitoxin system ParD family antitoxin [Zoogloeaceae bacterium]